MQPLPCNFLEQIASRYELSSKQKEAFLEQFGSSKDQQAIADALYISTNALRTRLSGVYTKFSIKGKGPGKVHKLRDFLTREYQRHHPSPIVNALEDGIDINALVQEVREKVSASIQNQCGTMRVLDMNQPIGLSDIYTNVNILEKITGRRRLGIEELLQECNSEDFERFG